MNLIYLGYKGSDKMVGEILFYSHFILLIELTILFFILFGNILLTTISLFFSILEQLLDNKTKIMKRILSVIGNFLLWQICIFVNFFLAATIFYNLANEKMLNYFKWLGTFAFVSEEYNFGLYMPVYSIKERIIRIGISLLFLVITYFYIFYTPIWKIKFFLKRLFKIKEKNSENIRVVKIGYIKGGIDKNGRF
ncbi:hypothetical protein [Fusobacterium animalis]|uniref:hypothetical protein n=1 Tax=Fusobacterium animalis TaxID=76859 RepID=UPI0035628C1E